MVFRGATAPDDLARRNLPRRNENCALGVGLFATLLFFFPAAIAARRLSAIPIDDDAFGMTLIPRPTNGSKNLSISTPNAS